MAERRSYRRIGILFAVLVAVLLQPFSFVDIASANWGSLGANKGFFTGIDVYNDYGTQVLPRDHAGQSMPEQYIKDGVNDQDRAARLYNFLRDHYYAGTNHENTGAAYIVRTMLGGGPGSSRTITNAEWADLNSRLQSRAAAGRINFFATIDNGSYGSVNTFYNTIDNDVAWYNSRHVRSGIQFTNDDGTTIAYALWYYCANPVGSFPGIPVTPPPNFGLQPTISASPSVVEVGTTVQPTANIANNAASGTTTVSTDAQWHVSQFTRAPGLPIPGPGLSVPGPLTYYGAGTTIFSTGTGTFNPGNNTISVPARTIADLPVGTRVCYALSVQPATHADGRWNNSTPACVTIAKSPKVQVRAGDLQVGRGSTYNGVVNLSRTSDIVTSITSKSGAFYGSWAEYGIIPTGTVSGMASGSGFVGVGGSGATTADLCRLSVLTFTVGNAGASCGTIGQYTQATIAPNVSARFPINVTAASAGPGRPASPAILPSNNLNITGNNLSGQYQAAAGTTAISVTGGSDIPVGRWVILNVPEATVTITGNIKYTDAGLVNLGDTPQVVIIARNIIIADGVSNVDAWLMAVGFGADGRINTCGADSTAPNTITETSALVYTECNTRLTVNGPVMANHLIMRRTAGSEVGAQSGEPAEIFNLRPDAYIWATYYNLSTGRLSTVATKELPPRF